MGIAVSELEEGNSEVFGRLYREYRFVGGAPGDAAPAGMYDTGILIDHRKVFSSTSSPNGRFCGCGGSVEEKGFEVREGSQVGWMDKKRLISKIPW